MAHILVVEDDALILSLAVRMLEVAGHTASPAPGGRQALAMLEQQMPDLILSDIRMPDLDGHTLFEEVRVRDSQVPFVAMSGHLNGGGVEALRFDAFLQKPFQMQTLVETVEQVLEGQPVA